jgi:hypothetical protein
MHAAAVLQQYVQYAQQAGFIIEPSSTSQISRIYFHMVY